MTDDKLNEALALSRDIETLKAMFDEQYIIYLPKSL